MSTAIAIFFVKFIAMFWGNVVKLNDIFIQKGVKINRAHISYSNSITLMLDEKSERVEDIDTLRRLLIVDNVFK